MCSTRPSTGPGRSEEMKGPLPLWEELVAPRHTLGPAGGGCSLCLPPPGRHSKGSQGDWAQREGQVERAPGTTHGPQGNSSREPLALLVQRNEGKGQSQRLAGAAVMGEGW